MSHSKSLTELFDSIQLQDLLAESYSPTVVEFIERTQKERYDSFFMDMLSYCTFINSEQQQMQMQMQDQDMGIKRKKSPCAFNSFADFTQMVLKNLKIDFNDTSARGRLIHRINCTTGPLYYQIQVWLQKCTFLFEMVASKASVGSEKQNLSSKSLLVFRSASRIPLNKKRAKVIMALADPKLPAASRYRLEEAYQSTR